MNKINVFFQSGLLGLATIATIRDGVIDEGILPWLGVLAVYQFLHQLMAKRSIESTTEKKWRLGYWWLLAINILVGFVLLEFKVDAWELAWGALQVALTFYYFWYSLLKAFHQFNKPRGSFLPNLQL